MFNNNLLMQQAAEAKKKKEEQERLAKLGKEYEAQGEAASAMDKDMERGAELGKEIVGSGLGRLSQDANLTSSRDQLAAQAQGMSSQESLAAREQALEQLQGAESAQQRALLSSLSNAGVTGGAAGVQLADLSSSMLSNRRRLERDLAADQAAAGRAATRDLVQVDSDIAKFDLGQLAKEKNIDIQSRLGYAELGSAERANIRSTEATRQAAEAAKRGKK